MQEITMEQIDKLSIFDMYRVWCLGYEFLYSNERYFYAVHTYKFYFRSHGRIKKLTFQYGFDGREFCLLHLDVRNVNKKLLKKKDNRSREIYSKCDFMREYLEVDKDVLYDILNNSENQTFVTQKAKRLMTYDLDHVCQNDFAEHINQALIGGY